MSLLYFLSVFPLRKKLESVRFVVLILWGICIAGDLFDMLLPMLGIYQEYVRNHHYSLQVLAEYKQKPEFNRLLKRFEEKTACEGRVLETFLTYPMHQVSKKMHEIN